jgi:hypothetical protein
MSTTRTSQKHSQTRAYYCNVAGTCRKLLSAQELMTAVDLEIGIEAVCVVENIDDEWRNTLMSAVMEGRGRDFASKLTDFFSQHKVNPSINTRSLWSHIFRNPTFEPETASYSVHIEGVLEYHGWTLRNGTVLATGNNVNRPCWQPDPPHSVSSYTKLSYYRIFDNVCKYTTYPDRTLTER